jgi:hypothetical protein
MLLCMACLARWPAGAACSRWPARPAAPRLALGWQHAGLQCLGPRAQQLVPLALALACWLELAARERHVLQAAAAAAAPAVAGCPRPLATRRRASASPHVVLQVRAPQPQKSPAHKQKNKEGGRQERNLKLQMKNTPSILNESK